VDRRSQRENTTKSETISLTVSSEAILLSCTIDAKEGRYVVVIDIPGASFMQTWTKMYTCF